MKKAKDTPRPFTWLSAFTVLILRMCFWQGDEIVKWWVCPQY
jgi:hypothetical protein